MGVAQSASVLRGMRNGYLREVELRIRGGRGKYGMEGVLLLLYASQYFKRQILHAGLDCSIIKHEQERPWESS
jgi:hypothetical protein